MRRPAGVWVATGGLAVAALGALVIGALMTLVSGIDPPPEAVYAVIGLVAAGCCASAALGVWSARLTRAAVLALAATVPLASLAGATQGVDFEALALLAILAWLGLALLLRRPAPAHWLTRRGNADSGGPQGASDGT